MLLPKTLRNTAKGFTLVELIIVMGILAVLLALVLVALNPGQRFIDANNTQRRSDINAILNAIQQYIADNRGAVPGTIDNTARTILRDATPDDAGEADLCQELVDNGYLGAMPLDPTTGTGADPSDCTIVYDTQYEVIENANNSVTVSAPDAEGGEVISVTR